MSRRDMAGLGNLLGPFLSLFADCFRRPAGRLLLTVYVRGLLSNVQRKNVEAMALAQGVISRQGTLLVARNVLTGEMKTSFGNRVPGRDGWMLSDLLRVGVREVAD